MLNMKMLGHSRRINTPSATLVSKKQETEATIHTKIEQHRLEKYRAVLQVSISAATFGWHDLNLA